jgi:hypothetical protein
MPTAPRQPEVQRPPEPERRVTPAPATAPGLRGFTPDAILALQRTAGNQAVARAVSVELRQAPPRPPQPPASDRATPENRAMASEIDTVDKLDDSALDRQRAQAAKQVAATDGAAHVEAAKKLDAIEYVAGNRQLAAPKLDWDQYDHVKHDQAKRRQFVRGMVEERVRELGSFEKALMSVENPNPQIQADLAVVQADAQQFATEFKGQARITAERMLKGSLQAISGVLQSYGIPPSAAVVAAGELLKGKGVEEEAAAVVRRAKNSADEPGGANEPASVTHRMRLAQWVERLKEHQQRVQTAFVRSNKADQNVSLNSGPADHHAVSARETLRAERDSLAGLWIQAERAHPVLATYRSGGPLEKVDLGTLDTAPVDGEMQAMLEHVLPKVASIARANFLIQKGLISPLSLPAVVAMTRANMFVPAGSIRAGVVRDLMDEAAGAQESGFVMAVSLALALLTLVPTGGASLAIPVGIASAGLAAYSAMKEFEHYDNQKTLNNTDLDRARALSDEEPSLAGFAMSLVGLGFEGMMLIHAFKAALQIKRLATAGEQSTRVNRLVDELNRLGKEHNAPDLGKRALDEAHAAKPRVGGEAGKTEDMPVPDFGGKTQDMPVPEAIGDFEGDEATKSISGAARPFKHPLDEPVGTPTYGTREEVRVKVTTKLLNELQWGDGTMLSKEYSLTERALRANPGPINTKILQTLPIVIRGVRDPELIGEVVADAWALAKARGININEALEEMARAGGAPIVHIPAQEGIMDAAKFFKKYSGTPAHIIDHPLAIDDHGAMTHLVQDLVVDRALRKAGLNMSSTEFRGLLGQAEGTVARDAGFETFASKTFEAGETEMQTGDYLWRLTYDNTAVGHINRPEDLGNKLLLLLGVR